MSIIIARRYENDVPKQIIAYSHPFTPYWEAFHLLPNASNHGIGSYLPCRVRSFLPNNFSKSKVMVNPNVGPLSF